MVPHRVSDDFRGVCAEGTLTRLVSLHCSVKRQATDLTQILVVRSEMALLIGKDMNQRFPVDQEFIECATGVALNVIDLVGRKFKSGRSGAGKANHLTNLRRLAV